MRASSLILLVGAAAAAVPCAAPAQGRGRPAAVYVRSLHLAGTIVFDPRPAYLKGTMPSRTPQEIDSLALLLGATSIADQSKYLVCSGPPKLCRIRGADAIISVNRPEVVEDTAYVMVSVLKPTPFSNRPITRREDRLLIVKAGGSWKFVEVAVGGSIS